MASAKLELIRSLYAAWARGESRSLGTEWADPAMRSASSTKSTSSFFSLQRTGKASGLELGQVGTEGVAIYYFRDGKVTKIVRYLNRERGLLELGLAAETSQN
jgi:hypothetical protein